MLYSYLLDPTIEPSLPEVALRQLQPEAVRHIARSRRLPDALPPLAPRKSQNADLTKVYDQIDLPLAAGALPHGARRCGIDCDVLADMSPRASAPGRRKAPSIYDKAGSDFNINSPKQLGDVLFNKMNLPSR